MQIYFHSRLCSYLPRVPILVEGTVCLLHKTAKLEQSPQVQLIGKGMWAHIKLSLTSFLAE